MTNPPLVTVVCLCYNHAKYVEAALNSIIQQTYPLIEVVAVDDASSDQSAAVIEAFASAYPHIKVLLNTSRQGNCRSFNEALGQTSGKYVIDLAADDVMPTDKISKQVAVFESLEESYGVVFTNAYHINEQGKVLGTHFPVDQAGKAIKKVPSGNVYQEILQQYLICTPTMMMRRSVLDALGGYDTSLSYEDFDFWVRSARKYQYHYLDELLMYKRKLPNSLSSRFYQRHRTEMLTSTLQVCHKAYGLNQTPQEHKALSTMIRYYLRQSFYTENFSLVIEFANLLRLTDHVDWLSSWLIAGAKLKLRTFWLYRYYIKMKN